MAIISPVAASAQTALDFNREAYIMASGSYSLAVDSLSLAVDMEDLKSSNNLQDPEIEIGYLWGEKPTGNKWNVSVSQGFDWPGAYSARAKGIKAAQEVIGLTRRAGLLSRMLEVKQAMIDVVYSAKNMMLTRQMTDTIASMCAISRKAMEGGEITRLDMNMMEIVRIGMEEELRTAVAEFDDKVAALTVLNNGHDCSTLVERLTDYPDEMILPLESYQRQITENDPMIKAGRKQMKVDEKMVKASQMMSYPGVSVGYTYENEGDERWHGVTFGLNPSNEIYASGVTGRGLFGSHAMLHIKLENQSMEIFPAEIPLPGGHMVLNALAAAGVGMQLALTAEEVKRGIAEVEEVSGRGNVVTLSDYTLIDGSYNANPESMRAAVGLLILAQGRKVAVLGDMFELGEKEEELHAEVGAYAQEKEIDVLICVGRLSKNMYEGALSSRKEKEAEVYYFESRDEMLSELPGLLKKGDTILVKASHGMHFEKVVEFLQKEGR